MRDIGNGTETKNQVGFAARQLLESSRGRDCKPSQSSGRVGLRFSISIGSADPSKAACRRLPVLSKRRITSTGSVGSRRDFLRLPHVMARITKEVKLMIVIGTKNVAVWNVACQPKIWNRAEMGTVRRHDCGGGCDDSE